MIQRFRWRDFRGFRIAVEYEGKTYRIDSRPITWGDLRNGFVWEYPISISKKVEITFPAVKWYDLALGVEYDVRVVDSGTEEPKNRYALTDLFTQTVTIYNDMPKTALEERHFDRFVLHKCNIQGGLVTRQNGTVQNVVNAQTVITKTVGSYRYPTEYAAIPVDLRGEYYTVKAGDLVVFGEVDDVVETASDFAAVAQKYRDNSIRVASVSVNINGMDVDNVTMQSV